MNREGLSDEEILRMLMESDEEELGEVSSDEAEEPDSRPGTSSEPAAGVSSAPRSAPEMGEDSEEDSDDEDEEPRPKRWKRHHVLWKTSNLRKPQTFPFDDSTSGYDDVIAEEEISGFLVFFQYFFSVSLISGIAKETNDYYKKKYGEGSEKKRSTKWKDTTTNELYIFLAISALMSRVKKQTINEYWSQNRLIETPIFGQLMPRDRYKDLLSMLHFSDDTGRDHLKKIRPVYDQIKAAFRSSFTPFQNLCIDESLLLYKGRLFFKQYIPNKRSRFGIKLFVLCDCDTSYILDFIIYTGLSTELVDYGLGVSGNVVATLLEPYLNKGHTVYVDNWYSSPDLFLWLHDHMTNAVGTARKNRKEMPKMAEKLKRGEFSFRTSENKLVGLKWQDKKEVWVLSTAHKVEMMETGKTDWKTKQPIMKPNIIVDYNKNMGAVDKTDMVLSTVECTRKTVKWYKKLFFHLVDMSIFNAHKLYQHANKKKVPIAKYHLGLIQEIVQQFHEERPKKHQGRRSAEDTPLRLKERHFLKKIPKPEGSSNQPMKDCLVCRNRHSKRKRTVYFCPNCNVPLCVDECFEAYHTQLKI